ncbi:hypothetical protein UFOVP71_182 [uncultured Caudovirales phage]|uniref:Uncharacterized protein n=1 Tax=uncultured Caudovirales phage TaxID=2100421 RepID=A0A6J5TBI6_9CAUD|nr:hypothetical protein UFOVP71_182 [uncultured Caudovirales phage]
MNLYHYQDDSSDKIWGWVNTGDGALSFWGRSRGSLAFKHYNYEYDAVQQARKKNNKGYREVTTEDHDRLLPEDFTGQLMLAKLGQVKF